MVISNVAGGRAGRVLCVDDNRDAADTAAVLLALYGYDTRACYDGPSALRAAAAFEPDACLIDLNMPGMDGDELAVELRAGQGPLLLIAVTARSDAGARARIAAAGFHRHLVKPAAADDLVRAVGGAAAGVMGTVAGA